MMYDKTMVLKQFDLLVAFAKAGVDLLIDYHDSYAYADFGDRGNPCWKPYNDDANARREVNALIGAVRQAMPHGSDRHLTLAKAVASDLGLLQISYDWLCKATARILQGLDNTNEIAVMGETSRIIKQRMAEKGLAEIHSIKDLYGEEESYE